MSRIGIRPVQVPEGVAVQIAAHSVVVKGPKGENSVDIPPRIIVSQNDSTISVERKGESPTVRALHGLVRSLVANAVKGVSEGFTKALEIKGVGFKAQMKGDTLILNIGFSHPVEFKKPADIALSVKGSKIEVTGFNKQRVGEIAAIIRRIRPPDSYKGKGLRYEGEVVRLKPGKAVKAAGGAA